MYQIQWRRFYKEWLRKITPEKDETKIRSFK